MMDNFSVRPATEDDLDQIELIENRVHKSPWTKDHFIAELGKPYSQVLVLTDDETDSVIGAYLVFWCIDNECEILNIVVDLPFRGLGYAKMMIRKMISLLEDKSIQKIKLDVRKSNESAIQLYQSLNFSISHFRKKFYSDGEDAYQMILRLDEPSITY